MILIQESAFEMPLENATYVDDSIDVLHEILPAKPDSTDR